MSGDAAMELWAEIARAYAAWAEAPFEPADWQLRNGEDLADAVLALPSVRRLLADRQAVERVEALAEKWERQYTVDPLDLDEQAAAEVGCAAELRRALGGAE